MKQCIHYHSIPQNCRCCSRVHVGDKGKLARSYGQQHNLETCNLVKAGISKGTCMCFLFPFRILCHNTMPSLAYYRDVRCKRARLLKLRLLDHLGTG